MDWLKLFCCVMLAIGALIAFCIVVLLSTLAAQYWGDAGVLVCIGFVIVALITVALYSEL